MNEPIISTLQAFFLGMVEGISEYLPISSTGHLVIASDLLGLNKATLPQQVEAIQAFEIVIQGGAILAVLMLYRKYIFEIILGLLGKSLTGKKLAINIFCGTLPVLLLGYLLKNIISTYLQFTGPVLLSLTLGGIAMIVYERFRTVKEVNGGDIEGNGLDELTWKQAFKIGGLQCLALWPGTSRSMVTIIGGMSCGLKRPAAAEFSFLLGMPALLAATLYKLLKNGDVLVTQIGYSSLIVGFLTSTIFAAFAVRWLVGFLNRNGLSYFGWYRIALAVVIFIVVGL